MNNESPIVENISEEVLNLLSETERENLKYYNSKGVRVKDTEITGDIEMLEEATEEDEGEEDIDDSPEEALRDDSSQISSTKSNILNDTNQDFSDIFSDF